ncbi:MAG: hypothetical protein U9R15_14185, partial [Chloroflexota bacterium]|nr:hypothetical protein [Chloroflexota bacterium]
MFRRHNKNLDARKFNAITKKAARIEDFLDDDDKEEITGEPQLPEEDKLTPSKSLPGAPRGMGGDVEEDYTPMSAEEIESKRKEHEDIVQPPSTTEGTEEEEKDIPSGFRDIMKNLLKEDSAEGKKEKAQQDKYGPSEKIQEIVDILKEFGGGRLMDVDVDTAQAIVSRSELPDLLKERSQKIFDSHSKSDMLRAEQMALSAKKAFNPKDVKDTTEWLRDTQEGQLFQRKIFDKYRIGRVMQMLENTVLTMAGQSVVGQPSRGESMSPDQRKENKRLDQLLEAVKDGTISREEFGDAKRRDLTLKQFLSQKKKESS